MSAEEIATGVYRLRKLLVNVYFIRGTAPVWVMIDAGCPGYARTIRREAERTFGTRPAAILLTHGHFDHVGALAARRSVETLAALNPTVVAAGHGQALEGPAMRASLCALADRLDRVMPASGRYVPYPAVTDERGVVHVPPQPGIAVDRGTVVAGVALAALGLAFAGRMYRRSRSVELRA